MPKSTVPPLDAHVSAQEGHVYHRIAAIIILLLAMLLIAFLAEPALSNPNLNPAQVTAVALAYLVPVALLAGSAVSMLHPNPKYRALGAILGIAAAFVFLFASAALQNTSALTILATDPADGTAAVAAVGGGGLGVYSAYGGAPSS